MSHGDRFYLPLQAGDTATQTVGCRLGNPNNCAKHSLRTVCAFVRADGICLEPPKSWAEQFRKVKDIQVDGTTRSNIKPGKRVRIVLKEDQGNWQDY